MKKGDVLKLDSIINSLLSQAMGRKCAYALVRNRNIIKDEVLALEQVKEPVTKYADALHKIAIKYAAKDGDKFILRDEKFLTGYENSPQFIEEKKILDTDIGIHKLVKDIDDILNQEVTFNFYKIRLDDLPENINGHALEAIMPLIIEEDVNDETTG